MKEPLTIQEIKQLRELLVKWHTELIEQRNIHEEAEAIRVLIGRLNEDLRDFNR